MTAASVLFTVPRASWLAALLFAGCTQQPRIVLGNDPPGASTFTPATPARQIAVDANNLYWLSWNVAPPVGWQGPETSLLVVTKANKDGSNPVAIARTGYTIENVYETYALQVEPAGVYFTDSSFIATVHPDGSGLETLLPSSDVFSGNGIVSGVAMDDTTIYWTLAGGDDPMGAVMAMPRTGGTPATVAPGHGNPAQLAVDATSVYWIDSTPSGDDGLYRVDKTGGADAQLGPAGNGSSIVLDDTNVYLNAFNLVREVAKTGGPSTVIMSGVFITSELAADADSIYMIRDYSTIIKMSKADDSVTTLLQGTDGDPHIDSLALDDASVYWTTENGEIGHVAK